MLHPHTARDDDELTFNVNDEVIVIEKGNSGWWRGRLGDQEGLFPSSYVSMLLKIIDYVQGQYYQNKKGLASRTTTL